MLSSVMLSSLGCRLCLLAQDIPKLFVLSSKSHQKDPAFWPLQSRSHAHFFRYLCSIVSNSVRKGWHLSSSSFNTNRRSFLANPGSIEILVVLRIPRDRSATQHLFLNCFLEDKCAALNLCFFPSVVMRSCWCGKLPLLFLFPRELP